MSSAFREMSESAEPAVELLTPPEDVKEDTEKTSNCSPKPSSSKLDQLFQDRYTIVGFYDSVTKKFGGDGKYHDWRLKPHM